jgi:hypothetical protein
MKFSRLPVRLIHTSHRVIKGTKNFNDSKEKVTCLFIYIDKGRIELQLGLVIMVYFEWLLIVEKLVF